MGQGVEIAHYFVDEAGDPVLFNRRRVVLVGKPGVSRYFMLGLLRLPEPEMAAQRLEDLRRQLLSDPYFQGVPSLSSQARKTAICFHAKDDLPEVRREVFKLLPGLGASVTAAVRRKDDLAVVWRSQLQQGRRLRENDIYDFLVEIVCANALHESPEIHVTFAKRGKASRQQALTDAIENGCSWLGHKDDLARTPRIGICSATPSESAGLQVIDYYLWALQRLYERSEERYFAAVREQYERVIDLDDTRANLNGQVYDRNNPLTVEKIRPETS